MPKSKDGTPPNAYSRIIEEIFLARHSKGARDIAFEREDIVRAAKKLGVDLPKNLGDVLYSFRHRQSLPESVRAKAPAGSEWVIQSVGRSKYRFRAKAAATLAPDTSLAETKVPDSTPGVISMYALSDEQALLAKLRYNRLIDVFTGVACYSLQSHLRTSVPNMGQVETDEIYIGIDRRGAHYVFPVQAKGGKDKLGVVQIEQDLALCRSKFRSLVCRPIGAQFLGEDLIALFEFEETQDGQIKKVAEKHYRLVPPEDLTQAEIESYRSRPL
jgi:hypothetical protein